MIHGGKRKYTKVSPADHQVMERLHSEYGLTYPQIADLYGCSRSRVVQIVNQFRQVVAA